MWLKLEDAHHSLYRTRLDMEGHGGAGGGKPVAAGMAWMGTEEQAAWDFIVSKI